MLSPPTTQAFDVLQLGMGWLPEQPGNGLDRMYHNLTDALPRAGVGVRGLVTGSDAVFRTSGGRVRAFAPESASLVSRLSSVRRETRVALLEHPVDLVAAHFALYAAPILDLLNDRPLVVHFHGPWALESGAEGASCLHTRSKKLLERLVYRRATRCIVLSEAFRDVLTREYQIPADRIEIVPGGVDVDRFDTGRSRSNARRHLGWPTDRPIVLSVRRLTHRMGLESLIDAIDEIRSQHPDVLLHIAGQGPLRDDLERRVDAAGLSDHVRLLGFVPDDDLPLAYRAADVSIVPTAALEGFGLITIESLAAGTPVLVTPVGGLPEAVSGLSSSLVLDGHTPSALAAGLHEALDAPGRLPSAAACQAYARRHFSWDAVARRTRAVYETALS
ncbi:MAG: glycosyltransferase family 4 protein [Salinivenus sp.]